MIDLTSLEKAVGSLQRAVATATDEKRMQSLDQDQRDVMRAGVIQNFEFTYEQCWKLLKRFLSATSPSAESIDPLSFRDLIRVGAQYGLIDKPACWFVYRKQRNLTSHTYDEAKAQSVFETAVEFVDDARKLLNAMQQRLEND